MAGTPTANYNIPTYADTDAPDLSGAYNDAMDIIDTQLKANADAIESASTGNYTGTAPITVNNGERKIGITTPNSVTVSSGAVQPSTPGAVYLAASNLDAIRADAGNAESPTQSQSSRTVPSVRAMVDYVAAHGGTTYKAGTGLELSGSTFSVTNANAAQLNEGETDIADSAYMGGFYRVADSGLIDKIANITQTAGSKSTKSAYATPNCNAIKQYVESKIAAAGAAYTGTAPIVVDNGSHAISVKAAGDYTWDENKVSSIGAQGVVSRVNLPNPSAAQRIDTQAGDYWTTGEPSITVPTVATLKAYVQLHTPNASTSAKGLVQLTTSPASGDDTMAVTGSGVVRLLSDRKTNAMTNVTVDMLKNLYVDNATGVVYYKTQTE